MLLSPQHDGFGDLKLSDPQDALKDQEYFDSGCSRHMTGNISNLTNFKEHDGGYVAFRGGAKGDQLGKFDGKSDEGIFVGYSTISKAFRVYNTRSRKVEENLRITFLENKPMITGTNLNDFADSSLFDYSSQDSDGHNKDKHGPSQESKCDNQKRPIADSSTKIPPVNTATPTYTDYPSDPLLLNLEDTRIFDDAYDDRDEGVKADYKNLETVISVSPIPYTRVHKDHPKEQIIGEVHSVVQTRKKAKQNEAGFLTFINK
nr:hypothetical protein [Tanacetum cinerariifolium]